jgi:hypothetical protein
VVCSGAIFEGFILVPSSIVDEKRRKINKKNGCWAMEWLDQIFVKRLLTKYPDRDGKAQDTLDVDRESIVYGKESIVRRDDASHSFL